MTTLTDAQISAYQRDGFLIIDKLVGGADLDALRVAYDEVLEAQIPLVGDRMLGGITRQVMVPSIQHPVFKENGALDAARGLLPSLLDDAEFLFDMLIYKPPGHPHETPWHQDMAYAGKPFAKAGSRIILETVQFWLALDDVDEENGCMHFLPGHQTEPLLEHHIASGDPSDDGRLLAFVDPETQVDLTAAVAAPLRAGGVTLHSYGTPHYTPPNRSTDRPRRAYIFNFARGGAFSR